MSLSHESPRVENMNLEQAEIDDAQATVQASVTETESSDLKSAAIDRIKSKWSKKKVVGLLTGVALGIGAPTTVGAVYLNGQADRLQDTSTSGPAVAGGGETPTEAEVTYDYVTEQEPYTRVDDPSVPELLKPGVLSSEQLSIWQSGDTQAQTDIGSQVLGSRISLAIHYAYEAKKQGTTPDLTWLSPDQGVINAIERIANQYIEVSDRIDPADVEWFGFDVCRSTDRSADLDPLVDICHQQNLGDLTTDFSEGNPIQIAVNRETSANDEFTEGNLGLFRLTDATVRLEGDTLTLRSLG